MQGSPNTSFIPQGPVVGAQKKPQARRFNIFSFIGLVILIAALALSGAAFVYGGVVEEDLLIQKQRLADARSKINQADIIEAQELDETLRRAGDLLDNHRAVSRIFTEIGAVTSPKVQFVNFALTTADASGVVIALDGVTDSFASYVQQERLLVGSDFFSSVTFNTIAAVPSEDGTAGGVSGVTFSFTVTVPLSSISYEPPVGFRATPVLPPVTTRTTAPAATETIPANPDTTPPTGDSNPN